jgi:hypothetical protein
MPKKAATRKTSQEPRRYWSRKVTETSHALDLEAEVFKRSPEEMARSLKRSAERSAHRKASPFRSAMSMLTFYANRAGKNLSAARKRRIERAKDELRKLYGRETRRAHRSISARAGTGTPPRTRQRKRPRARSSRS